MKYDHFHWCIIQRKRSSKASAVWWYVFFCRSYESESCLFTIPKGSVGYSGCWKWKWCFQRACWKNNLKAIRNPQNPHRFHTGIRFAFRTIQWNIYGEETYAMEPVCQNLYGRQILVSNGSLCFSQGVWGFGFEFCVCSLTHRVHGTGINIPTFSIKHQPNTWMVWVRKKHEWLSWPRFGFLAYRIPLFFGLRSWIEWILLIEIIWRTGEQEIWNGKKKMTSWC